MRVCVCVCVCVCACVCVCVGRYRSKDGDVYEGKFQNGERQGVGKYAPISLLLVVAYVSIRQHTSAYVRIHVCTWGKYAPSCLLLVHFSY